jgi:hypothetical protein
MESCKTLLEQAELAEGAGFTAAGAKLRTQAERMRKLAVAYEHYRYVSTEQIESYVAKLKAATLREATDVEIVNALQQMRNSGFSTFEWTIESYRKYATKSHDTLVLAPMEKYAGLPPVEVLNQVKEAKSRGCFDAFVVASVEPVATKIVLPDPIVFGRVDGCTDYFFIGEWGSDVSINDLIGKHDG